MTPTPLKQLHAGLLFFLLLSTLAAIVLFNSAYGSNGGEDEVRFIYLDSPANDYIDYLINSRQAAPGFVFLQPFELDSSFWARHGKPAERYFDRYWQYFYGKHKAAAQLTAGDKIIADDSLTNRYRFSAGVHYVAPHITLGNRTFIDEDYKYDPQFAGDLSEAEHWLYGRVNDAYINLRFNKFDFFFGRMHRNWGALNTPGLLLSDHAYTYDHALFSYTTKNLKLSLIFAQLEDLPGAAVEDKDNPDSTTYYPNARKYLVGHRLDVRFSDRFQIAFSEVATYGGPDRDIELAFFNPMNFYYPIQRNDREQMNGHWTLDVFYKPMDQLSLYSQFFIDDVIVNNDPGEDDRARYPDRFGLMVSARTADALLPGFNAGLTYVRIWNDTYRSRWNWENYHYRQLGLGYPCASCEEAKIDLSYWGFFPLFMKNEFIVGRYGSIHLTDVFRGRKKPFPAEPVMNNVVNHLTLRYFFSTYLEFRANVHYLKNAEHYSNRIDMRDEFFFSIGVRLNLSAGFPTN